MVRALNNSSFVVAVLMATVAGPFLLSPTPVHAGSASDVEQFVEGTTALAGSAKEGKKEAESDAVASYLVELPSKVVAVSRRHAEETSGFANGALLEAAKTAARHTSDVADGTQVEGQTAAVIEGSVATEGACQCSDYQQMVEHGTCEKRKGVECTGTIPDCSPNGVGNPCVPNGAATTKGKPLGGIAALKAQIAAAHASAAETDALQPKH